MNRSGILGAVVLLTVGGVYVGCTQDFDQFEPRAGTSGPSSTSGAGGAGSTTTTSAGGGTFAGSGGSTSSTTTSTTATTTSTSTSTTGTGVAEDCTNGLDDDGDGDADCADTDCNAGYACVDTVPGNWQGPVVLYDGPTGMLPAACPGDFPTEQYRGGNGLNPAPAQCSMCTCMTPTIDCTLNPISTFLDNACSQAGGVLGPGAPDQCQAISPGAAMGATAAPPTAMASACTPSQVQATKPPPDWTSTGLACGGATTGGGCGAKAACVAKPAAPFDKVCVYRSGDQVCPAPFTEKHTFIDDVIDTRDCTPCTCGDATGTCTATTTFYSGPNCNSGTVGTLDNDGQCHTGVGGKSMKTVVATSGSCPPDGGQPTGSIVEGASTTTVCCMP